MVSKEGRFLKHYTKKYATRTGNIGYDYPRTVFLRTIEERLNLEPGSLTTHFSWRSAATALADAGISITNLKRAGRWKSDTTAERYLKNSSAQKKEQLSMLGPDEEKKCCPPSTVHFPKNCPNFQY
eukprot:15354581-Ditylum_brightwellii.AAC.1